MQHSGSRGEPVGVGVTRRARGYQLPANLHSQRSLVSRMQRYGGNMAEGVGKVRIEERLKIKIGELRDL